MLQMYLRTIGNFVLAFKRCKKIILGSPHFREGGGSGGVMKSVPPVHLKKLFLTLSLWNAVLTTPKLSLELE